MNTITPIEVAIIPQLSLPLTDAYGNELKDKMGIYRIFNTITSKSYVGSSKNLRSRQQNHLNGLKCNRHHSSKLQKSWDKYGADAFWYEILEFIDTLEELIPREQFWIDKLSSTSREYGYNIALLAGNPGSTVKSPEVRARIAATLRGRKRPPEVGARISAVKKGYKRSPEVIERHRQKMKGRKPSQATLDAVKRCGSIYIAHEHNKVAYAFVSPEGVLYEGRGIKEFALTHGLDPKQLSRLNLGKVKSHQGWTQPDSQTGMIKFVLQSPDGSVHYGENLKAFALKQGIKYGLLFDIIQGKRKNPKGWKLFKEDNQINTDQ